VLTEDSPTAQVTGWLAHWRRHFHFDRHVLSVLLQRGWSIIAGGMTVVFIPLWMTQVEQGFYYAFFSVLALQVFFDLGINFVVVQLVGHEAAKLTISDSGLVQGEPARVARLRSLVVLLRRWYLIAGTLFCLALSIIGIVFFGAKGGLPIDRWAPVWIALVIFTSINLYLSPSLAVLEGIGRVRQVAQLRLIQSAVGYVGLWLALALQAGLYAMPIIPATAAVLGPWWLRRNGLKFPKPRWLATVKNLDAVRWRTDVFPLQWRIALSWVSGYFIFNAFTPLIFAHQGAIEAGKVGIALAVFSSLSTLVMSWSNAVAPRMVNLIANDERSALNSLFFSVLKSSFVFGTLSSGIVLGGVYVLHWFDSPLLARIASLPTLCCLAIVTITNSIIFAAAAFMRAHKEEPMLAPSLVGGILTLLVAYYASSVSVYLTMALYAGLTVFIGLPWTIFLLLPYLRKDCPELQVGPNRT